MNRTRNLKAAVAAAALTIGLLAQSSSALALPMPPSSKATTLTCGESSFAGYLCLWKNEPRDSKGSANWSAIQNYNDYGWYNETGTKLDNHTSYLRNRWSLSVTVYQNINYNSSGTAGERCYGAGAAASNLKSTNYATGSGSSMNDSLSSHRNVGQSSTC